jgi:hypothetical protein
MPGISRFDRGWNESRTCGRATVRIRNLETIGLSERGVACDIPDENPFARRKGVEGCLSAPRLDSAKGYMENRGILPAAGRVARDTGDSWNSQNT